MLRRLSEQLEGRVMLASQAYDWENVVMGGAGFVSGIVVNPTSPNVMYARTDIGGAYRWDAVNNEWDPMLDWVTASDWTLYGVESIASDPVDPNRVYAACGTYTNSWSGNGAILRSSDRGVTWARTNVPFKFGGNEDGRSNGERLAVDPNKNSILFLGTRDNGLWKSTDYGATWNQVSSFPVTTTTNGVGLNLVEFIKSSGTTGNPTQTIYAGVADGAGSLYKSTNGGATWTLVPNMPAGKFPHHAAQDGLGNMYLTYNDAPGPNGVTAGIVAKLKLSDDTWTNVTPSSLSGGSGLGGVSVDKQNPTTLIVSTMDKWWRRDDVYRSRNGGSTWVALRGQNATDQAVVDGGVWNGQVGVHWTGDIEIDPFNSNKAWFITGFGIWSIDDLSSADAGQPTHWRLNDKGLEEAVVQDIEAPPGPVEVYDAIFDYSGFRHTDVDAYPSGMMQPSLGSASSIDFARLNSNYVVRVGGGSPYGVYSTDGGVTWTGFASTPTGTGGGKIAMSADGARLVWNIGGAMYYSTNNGATWTASTTALSLVPVADAVNPLKFYAYDAAAGVVWISTNGGVSFTAGGTVPTGGGNIEPAMGIEGDIWLAQSAGLYHSTNSGASFTKITSTSSASKVTLGKAAPGESYPAIYLRGTANGLAGLHRSDDGGATWAQIDDPQHQFGNLNDIAGDPDVYGRIYLASQHRGVIFGEIGGPVIGDTPTLILDNSDTAGISITGSWTPSSSTSGYYGSNYLQDGNTGKGTKSVRFTPTIAQADTYEVYARWTAAANRATNTPIDIIHAGGTSTITANQQTSGGTWNLLGTYSFNAGTSGSVLIRTTGTNGYVIADAVKFVQVGATTPPTIVTPAAASPGVVNGVNTSLSVLGADYLGESYLTYSWFADGPTRVKYSSNFTNAAKNTAVTFKKTGTYVFTCTIRDPRGRSVTSSVSVVVNSLTAGLTISGTSSADTIRLVRSGANLLVYLNNPTTPTSTYSFASLTSLALNSLGGNDSISLDFSGGGSPIPSGGIAVDSGTGSDTLTVIGSTSADAALFSSSSMITFNNAVVSYSNVETLGLDGKLGRDVVWVQSLLPVNISKAQELQSLDIADDVAAILTASAGIVLDTNSLSLNRTGKLDINDNAMIVRTVGAKDLLTSEIISAMNGYGNLGLIAWTGSGITSSSARLNNLALGIDLYAVGIIRNGDLDILNGAGSRYLTWKGKAVGSDDLLIRYTYFGDADLNGLVNIDDYNLIDSASLGTIPDLGWVSANFDFAGSITIDDYNAIDTGYLYQLGPL